MFVTDVGKPCDPRNALRALTTAARQAGLPHVGLHTLRHSAASVMLSEGVPISVVSQILGHSGISITADVYGHIAPDVSRSALDILGAALTHPTATRPGTGHDGTESDDAGHDAAGHDDNLDPADHHKDAHKDAPEDGERPPGD